MVETPVDAIRITPLDHPACTINDRGGALAGSLFLSVNGHRFASLDSSVESLAIQVANDLQQGTVQVTTESLRLNANFDASKLRVAQLANAEPIDGWIRLESSLAESVGDGSITVGVTLPHDVESTSAPKTVRLACSEVSALVDKVSTIGEVDLRAGTSTPLRTRVGGPVVAQLREPSAAPVHGNLGAIGLLAAVELPRLSVVEKRPGWWRITQGGPSTSIIGWIPASAIDTQRDFASLLGALSGMGTGGGSVRCREEVPIFVNVDGTVYDVGSVRANAAVPGERLPTGEIRLTLEPIGALIGLLGDASLPADNDELGGAPYVPKESAALCTIQAPR